MCNFVVAQIYFTFIFSAIENETESDEIVARKRYKNEKALRTRLSLASQFNSNFA
jgi:hypothetical protein